MYVMAKLSFIILNNKKLGLIWFVNYTNVS